MRRALVARYVGPISGLMHALQMDKYFIQQRILLERYKVYGPAREPEEVREAISSKFFNYVENGGYEMDVDTMHKMLRRAPVWRARTRRET